MTIRPIASLVIGVLSIGWTDADLPPALGHEADEAWQLSFAPYIWLPGIEGDVTLRGVSAPINASIHDTIDAIDELDFALMGHFEAEKEGSGFLVDLVTMGFEDDFPSLSGTGSGDIEFDMLILELGGFTELTSWDCDPADPARCSLDLLGGGRLWYFGLDIDDDNAGLGADGSLDWIDPFIGLRVKSQLDERWSLIVRGDIGGFSMFDSADATWQAQATLAYRTDGGGDLGLGWRHLAVDYDQGSTAFDARLSGPYLGYLFRF